MIGTVGNGPVEMSTAALIALSLMLVGGLAFAAWWNGRSTSRRTANPIRILGSRMVGGKRWLTLVEVQGEHLLLATGGEQVTLIRSFAGGERQGCSCSLSPVHLSPQSPPNVLSQSLAGAQHTRLPSEGSGKVAQEEKQRGSTAELSLGASVSEGSWARQ